MVVAALVWREPWLLAVAAVGVLLFLPGAVAAWFPNSLIVPLSLLGVGAALLVTALLLLRGAGHRGPRAGHGHG